MVTSVVVVLWGRRLVVWVLLLLRGRASMWLLFVGIIHGRGEMMWPGLPSSV
jgi:hypothetical protein